MTKFQLTVWITSCIVFFSSLCAMFYSAEAMRRGAEFSLEMFIMIIASTAIVAPILRIFIKDNIKG